jgi:transcriptional regulator with XRE-family HTH domain
MGNYLPMASQQQVRALLQLGWSHRRIARELGVHRETVSKYASEQRAGPPVSIAASGDACRRLSTVAAAVAAGQPLGPLPQRSNAAPCDLQCPEIRAGRQQLGDGLRSSAARWPTWSAWLTVTAQTPVSAKAACASSNARASCWSPGGT